MSKPEAEFNLTPNVVRALLDRQYPQYAQWSLRFLDSGWDNSLFRLGETLIVRLPRREIGAQLIRQEQVELPVLATRLDIPIPAPIHIGQPQNDYPWAWSIVPWFEGDSADLVAPAASEVERFVDFLMALHQPAPKARATNPMRGVALSQRHDAFTERMERLKKLNYPALSTIENLWQTGLHTSSDFAHCWVHGDLHGQNVIVHRKQIAAVIDWGDLTAGDRAVDLASAWTLFAEPEHRRAFIHRYSPSIEVLSRAKAWAAFIAVVLLDSGLTNSPRHARQGKQVMARLIQDH